MSDEDKQTTTQSVARWMRIEREGLSYKIEAIVKDCISYAIATSIAVFGLGVILAPSMGALLVQCIGCLVLMWPTLMFSVFAIHPSSFYFIFLAMIYTTILLCAAVVSDGLFVVVFGLMPFLFLGNYFDGPRVGVNLEESLPPGLVLSIVAILALTYRHLVQVGPSIEFLPGEVDINSLNAIERSIVDASSTMIEVLRASSDGKISFECPEEAGIFAGQTCTISNSTTSSDNPAALTASVNGGLYIVAAFWTEMGLDNPFALLYNLIIGTCWLVLALALPIFIPPVRRFRDVLRSLIIPGTLSSVAAMLETKSKEETHVAGDESNPFMAEKQTLSAIAKKLSPKKNAGLLYFEPRLCHVPTIDHIPYMEAFLNNIQSVVLVLYNYSGYRSENGEQPDHSQSIQVLRTVATAVKENDLSILEGVDAKSINWDDTEGGLHELSLSEIIGDISSSIYSSSRVWLKAYNDIDIKEEEKNRVTVVRRTLRAWLTNAFCACSNITSSWPFIAIRLLLGKQGADLQNMSTHRFIMTILWSIKWTAGAVALTCVEIYGKGFHADWLIRQEMGSNTNYVVLGTLQGWVLFSYFLAFQFSMEGTIKKVSPGTISTFNDPLFLVLSSVISRRVPLYFIRVCCVRWERLWADLLHGSE